MRVKYEVHTVQHGAGVVGLGAGSGRGTRDGCAPGARGAIVLIPVVILYTSIADKHPFPSKREHTTSSTMDRTVHVPCGAHSHGAAGAAPGINIIPNKILYICYTRSGRSRTPGKATRLRARGRDRRLLLLKRQRAEQRQDS